MLSEFSTNFGVTLNLIVQHSDVGLIKPLGLQVFEAGQSAGVPLKLEIGPRIIATPRSEQSLLHPLEFIPMLK